MAGLAASRNVFELAIDSALIRHVEKLFETFASDVELELNANPDELRNSATPSAKRRFERKFDIAVLTHSEMVDVLRRKNVNEVA